MKLLKLFICSLLLVFFSATSAYAIEFKDIEFVDGTLLGEKAGKYVSLKDKSDLRFYISSTGQVEFIDKKNNLTTQLFENIQNPLLIYRITTKKSDCVFYAIFDRSVSVEMQTQHFALIGMLSSKDKITEFANLETLKASGWTANGLQLRIDKKQLVIEGITKVKSSPDHKMQPFFLTWDESLKQFAFEDKSGASGEGDAAKVLKAEDFVIAGVKLGDSMETVASKLGDKFSKNEGENAHLEKDLIRHKYDNDLDIYYVKDDNTVWGIYTKHEGYATARGIATGMTKDEMFEKYGHNYRKKRENRYLHYVYSMKKQYPGSSDSSEIGFAMNDKDKIIFIYVNQWDKAFS